MFDTTISVLIIVSMPFMLIYGASRTLLLVRGSDDEVASMLERDLWRLRRLVSLLRLFVSPPAQFVC